jgi:hypothetical protein
MIKKTFGGPLTTSYATIYEVPQGKKAEWVLLYVVNDSGSTSGFSVRMYNAQSDSNIQIFDDKSLSDGEFFKIGGGFNEFIMLAEGDKVEAVNGSGMTLLMSVVEYNDIIQGG